LGKRLAFFHVTRTKVQVAFARRDGPPAEEEERFPGFGAGVGGHRAGDNLWKRRERGREGGRKRRRWK
jgi:hypothetical protein